MIEYMSSTFRNVRDYPHLPIVIEMHKWMWTDQMKNYFTRDLCLGGALYTNPDLLTDLDQRGKDRIRNGNYNVIPISPDYFRKKSLPCVINYIMVTDSPTGMYIFQTNIVEQES